MEDFIKQFRDKMYYYKFQVAMQKLDYLGLKKHYDKASRYTLLEDLISADLQVSELEFIHVSEIVYLKGSEVKEFGLQHFGKAASEFINYSIMDNINHAVHNSYVLLENNDEELPSSQGISEEEFKEALKNDNLSYTVSLLENINKPFPDVDSSEMETSNGKLVSYLLSLDVYQVELFRDRKITNEIINTSDKTLDDLKVIIDRHVTDQTQLYPTLNFTPKRLKEIFDQAHVKWEGEHPEQIIMPLNYDLLLERPGAAFDPEVDYFDGMCLNCGAIDAFHGFTLNCDECDSKYLVQWYEFDDLSEEERESLIADYKA
jgi:hypothetical protein